MEVISGRTHDAGDTELGWRLFDGGSKTCTAGVQMSCWRVNSGRLGMKAKKWKVINGWIMVRRDIRRGVANVMARHGDVEASDVYIFGKVVQKLAGFVFCAGASEPKAAQGAFKVMTRDRG